MRNGILLTFTLVLLTTSLVPAQQPCQRAAAVCNPSASRCSPLRLTQRCTPRWRILRRRATCWRPTVLQSATTTATNVACQPILRPQVAQNDNCGCRNAGSIDSPAVETPVDENSQTLTVNQKSKTCPDQVYMVDGFGNVHYTTITCPQNQPTGQIQVFGGFVQTGCAIGAACNTSQTPLATYNIDDPTRVTPEMRQRYFELIKKHRESSQPEKTPTPAN